MLAESTHVELKSKVTDDLKKMIKESDGETYEKIRSINQDLTFDYLKREFSKRDLPFEENHKLNLGLITSNGDLYTNLGLLLSDQAVHSIKVAVFQGKDKRIFRDRREFTGSVLEQFEKTFEYIHQYNRQRAEIKDAYRVDKFDYPIIAIREVLLNAIAHREYALSGSILISIFDNRLEVVTIGGLVSGISLDDILLGVSQTRNEGLANILYRLELVEAYGTGITKITESYAGEVLQPNFEVSTNAFKVTLFNRNYFTERGELTDSEEKVMEALESSGKIVRKDVEAVLGVSQTMAGRVLKKLVEKEKIAKKGEGPKVYYYLK